MWIRGKDSTQNYVVKIIHTESRVIPQEYLRSAACFTVYSHNCGYTKCDKNGIKELLNQCEYSIN